MSTDVKIKQFIPRKSIDPKIYKNLKKSSRIYILISFTCMNFLINQNEQNRQTLEVISKNHLISMS